MCNVLKKNGSADCNLTILFCVIARQTITWWPPVEHGELVAYGAGATPRDYLLQPGPQPPLHSQLKHLLQCTMDPPW
jgi:hypothetical protein